MTSLAPSAAREGAVRPPVPWLRPVALEGGHVRLEPLATEHLDALCDVGLDPALWELTISRVRDRAEMRAYLDAALAEQAAGRALPFVIVDRSSGRVAGSTRYGNAEPRHRRVEIGWTWVGRPWQRTALNTEAKLLLLRHGFERLGCLRIEFKTDVLNERSRRALLRIGAREEGVLRAHQITDGGRVRDSVYFSVIAPEWPAVEERLLVLLDRGASGAVAPAHGRPSSDADRGANDAAR